MDEKVVLQKQDLSFLNWTKTRNSSGTAGSFLKAYTDFGNQKLYYKLSNYNSIDGVVGHECVNEIIIDRLLTLWGIPHLNYKLINAEIIVDGKKFSTYVCMSEDFKEKSESKLALDLFYDIEKNADETPLEFCKRMGWSNYIYQMLVVDFIILNRDRHGANIEVLRNKRKHTLRLAPLFDHGLSLLFNCLTNAELDKFDVMKDGPVQCFVGGRNVFNNLELIPQNSLPILKPLSEEDKKILFYNLDGILPMAFQNKIWQMLCTRWRCYEDFCNKR